MVEINDCVLFKFGLEVDAVGVFAYDQFVNDSFDSTSLQTFH